MISDIISVLGFLGKINDKADRELKEKELFNATKNIIIDFIETSIKLMNDKSNNKQYVIGIKSNGHMPHITMIIADKKEDMIWDITRIEIANKYKFTKKQEQNIISIIINMPPTVYNGNLFSSRDDKLYMFKVTEIISNSIQIDEVNNYYYSPTAGIVKRLEELKQGDWDSYIMTSILELG